MNINAVVLARVHTRASISIRFNLITKVNTNKVSVINDTKKKSCI